VTTGVILARRGLPMSEGGAPDTVWGPHRAGSDPVETVPGFADLHEVARGGDSIVYRARQVALGRDVALKVLLVDDPETRHRFRRELDLTIQLGRQHPNIVTVLDTAITDSGRPCIVMDYFERGSIDDRLRTEGPLPVADVVAVGLVLADALDFAHAQGVLHRDVKPQNVLVLPTSYVLADFGIARLADSAHTASAERFSYRHASPQVLDGLPADVTDDVWSLGSTLFTLLDGRPPFASDDPADDTPLAYLRRVRTQQPRALRRPDLPPTLVRVVQRCLAKERADRYPDAASVRADLRQAHDEVEQWAPHASEPAGDFAHSPFAQPAPASATSDPAAPQPSAPTARGEDAWAPRHTEASAPAESAPPAGMPTAAPVAHEPGRTSSTTAPVGPRGHALSALEHHPRAASEPDRSPTERAPVAGPSVIGPETTDPPTDRRRLIRRLLIVGAVMVLVGGLAGAIFTLRSRTPVAQPTRTPTSTAAQVPTVSTAVTGATSMPPIADPELTSTIIDLRATGTGFYLQWSDPSGGNALPALMEYRGGGAPSLVVKFTPGVTTHTLDVAPGSGQHCYSIAMFVSGRQAIGPMRCATI